MLHSSCGPELGVIVRGGDGPAHTRKGDGSLRPVPHDCHETPIGQSLVLPFGVSASTPYSKNGMNISSQLCSAQ